MQAKDPPVAGRAGAPAALPSPVPGVALWWSDLAHSANDIERFAPYLSPAETARAARYGTDALRAKYMAGRATLRLLLGRALGIDAPAVPLQRGLRGRPELAGATAMPDFNVSHTRGGAVLAIAGELPSHFRIGVDVEREDRRLPRHPRRLAQGQRGHAGFASVNCSCSADICRSHLGWCAAFFA